MTGEALKKVRQLLGEIDDTIYRDCRERGLEFTYSSEELRLTEIVDEAQGQTTKMMEMLG